MKHFVIICLSFVAAAYCHTVSAQCNSPLLFTASKTSYLDSTNKEIRTVDEPSSIVIDGNGITISWADDKVMTGKITTMECKWSLPFKEGKSVMRSSLSNGSNEERAVTMRLEGKGGIVTFLITIDEDPNKRIRLVADKFQMK